MTDRSKSSSHAPSRPRSMAAATVDLSSPLANRSNDISFSRTVIASPQLSPNSKSMSMLFSSSPSRTIMENLNDLATRTGEELEKEWDVIGLDPSDRAAQMSDLVVRLNRCCDAKIADEKKLAETYREEISGNKQKILSLSYALKEETDIHGLEAASINLLDELASTATLLEELQAKAAMAMKDLAEIREVLIESHQALGLDMDPQWDDIESDLTASRVEEFREKKQEMEEELSSRSSAVIKLVQGCMALMDDLRLDAEIDGTDLDRCIAGSIVTDEKGTVTMKSRIRSESCIGISSQAIEDLTERSAALHRVKEWRANRLKEMGYEISKLWEKLRVPNEEQEAFTRYAKVHGLSDATIEKGEAELERLRVIKSEKMCSLIVEARDTISVLWDKTNTRKEDRDSFRPILVSDEDLFNDELLLEHDMYIQILQEKVKEMQPILRLIERREFIVSERLKYENLKQQPERFHQPGASRQLMAEEKMEKRIKRDLPKIQELLQGKLEQWEKDHNEPFGFQGHAYSERMAQQESEWFEFKESLEMERKRKKKQGEDPKDKHFGKQRLFAENRHAKTTRGMASKK